MVLLFNRKHPNDIIDYPRYLLQLQKKGLNKIAEQNGLSVEDNLRLTTTPHIGEVVYLILKGLAKLFTN
jgi:hypothetical protein